MAHLRIGDLARLGGVSVRTLRHYHELGVLVPAAIDPTSGHRFYEDDQIGVLRQILQLRDLGLALDDIGRVVSGQCSPDEFRALLVARRNVLEAEIAAHHLTIEQIDDQLPLIGQERPVTESTTTTIDVEIKSTEPRLVAQLTAVAESWAPSDIGPVIQPLYPELMARLDRAGVAIAGPSTAWYEDTDEGRVLVHATLTIAERPQASSEELGFEIAELPGLARAASTIHRGTMDNCDDTYQALLAWIDENGHQPMGYGREIDIECGPDREWITEIQIELAG